jgi:hypothetical protein
MFQLLFVLAFLLNGVQATSPSYLEHDFKLSVCEIYWSETKQHFEVKFYIFHDDLRAAVYGNPNHPVLESEDVTPYLMRHFEMSVSGQVLKLSFESYRQKDDQVLYQYNSPGIRFPANSKIQVKNEILTDKFRDQINMVYVIFPGQPKQTQMLNASKSQALFNL